MRNARALTLRVRVWSELQSSSQELDVRDDSEEVAVGKRHAKYRAYGTYNIWEWKRQ
jgi:hypothetical protein